jgi:hypothetical protein
VDSAGIVQLERAGLGFFRLLEQRSEFALPRLAEQEAGTFDLVFLDGWHTFDHTLVDAFYATRLLRIGGYLVLDDAYWKSVYRVADYLANYPCYQRFRSVDSVEPTSWKRRAARLGLSLFPRRRVEATLSRPALRVVYATTEARMLALRKVAEDERSSTWHDDRF